MQRRTFVKTGAGAVAASSTALAAANRVLGANDKIRCAVLGVNDRGQSHCNGLQPLDNVEVTTLVDPDLEIGRQRAGEFEAKFGHRPKVVQDMRRVLDDKDIDVITVATPNHWHTLAAIWACQAGKDVYIEKPATHCFNEGKSLIAAAHKYKRIVQVGHQSRSMQHKIRAIELLREGVIGKLYMARGLCFKRRKSIGAKATGPVPPGVNYDIWLGPSQELGFKENRFHYNWHWYWDFGNGDIGNQGVHEMDIARWGLGKEELPPAVYSSGGHYIYPDDQQTPNTQTAVF